MQIFPSNFLSKYIVEGHKIEYFDFIEAGQGGPEVATLTIDNSIIGNDALFGGPPYYFQGKMFVPRFIRNTFHAHFKLCIINLADLSIKEIGEKKV